MDQDPSTDQKVYASWPPTTAEVNTIGFLKDATLRFYPRVIGRSTAFKTNGSVLFVFGDTYCYDNFGEFVSMISSSASVLLDPDMPKISNYRRFNKDRTLVSFIPLNKDELEFEKNNFNTRVTLWCFGGIIELSQGSNDLAEGCLFFQKGIERGPFGSSVFQYTGIARVTYDKDSGKIRAYRIQERDIPFFNKDEPQFGTFNTMRIGDTAYLYGHAGPGDYRLMLAKVELINGNEIYYRNNYLYWNGTTYQPDIKLVQPVMYDMQQGAIYRSKLFRPGTGHDYVFVGCNSLYNNKVFMGTSPKPEGPFEIFELMRSHPLRPNEGIKWTYCVYPHQWAFDEEKQELMITWSEGCVKGQVVAVKVRLRKE